MMFSNKILSQTITQLCLASEIYHIVISPGSRNAPLIIGFTEHPDFKCFSIVDERSAAFFALGLAQQLKKPVALVCTSGSALLNYYPAVAEAFYSDIPLVVISADRPKNLIDIGDGQTIRQENVFENHILYNANCLDGEEHQEHNEGLINAALNTAFDLRGPVHINAPFSEPLYGKVSSLQVEPKRAGSKRTPVDFKDDLTIFANKWNKSDKKMIVVGVLAPFSIEQKFIDALARDESVIVLTETTSNLHHNRFFPAIDQLIAPLDQSGFEKLEPELLLTFGGMIVSKKIKAFLRTYAPKEHWHVDAKKAYDTFFKLTHHFKIRPNNFLAKFVPITNKIESTYNSDWQEIKEHRLKRHFNYEKEIVFSDFTVFSEIFRTLPKEIQLQLSNSATVRYAQLFEVNPEVQVFCNRGTSGIDGSMSTALGASNASNITNVFVSGDLSFFYDSNALWNSYIPATFRIIVINNYGGGIFRILPGAMDAEHFENYFETRHSLTAVQLADMYDFGYVAAKDEISLSRALKSFYNPSERPKLLEIFTPSEINNEVLLNYFEFIK